MSRVHAVNHAGWTVQVWDKVWLNTVTATGEPCVYVGRQEADDVLATLVPTWPEHELRVYEALS